MIASFAFYSLALVATYDTVVVVAMMMIQIDDVEEESSKVSMLSAIMNNVSLSGKGIVQIASMVP